MEHSHGLPNSKGVASSFICALIDCNLVTFLVRAFSQSKDKETALKAYDMLQDMIDEVVVVRPNTTLVNTVLRMLARFHEEEQAEQLYKNTRYLAQDRGFDIIPDIITFNTMANIYFRSEHKDSCRKLSEIVQEVEDAFDLGGLMPFNTFSHSVLINKLSKSENRGAAENAYEVLMKMEHHFSNGLKNCVRPDTIMYNMVLAQTARKGSKNSANKAMQIIQQMEKMSHEGNSSALPDTLTYTSGINAWVKSGSSETNKNVVEIFDKMDKLLMDESSSVQLDTVVFETTLQGFQSGTKEDEEMAKRVFERMVALYQDGNKLVQPSASSCNLVLKAHCITAKRSDRIKSLFDAHDMLLKFAHRYTLKKNRLPPK